MKRTLRQELLYWLLTFTISSIVFLGLVSLYSLKKKSEIDTLVKKITALHLFILKEITVHNDFFNRECINPQFFITHKSNIIVQDSLLRENISLLLKDIYSDPIVVRNGDALRFNLINQYFATYEHLFDLQKQLLLKRGFKDWGCEGKMRIYGHLLEDFSDVNKVTALQIRRREKDFIIRNDTSYIPMVKKFIQAIIKNTPKSAKLHDSIINCAKLYIAYFDSMSVYQLRLGIKDGTGLEKESNDVVMLIDKEMNYIIHLFETEQQAFYRSIYVYYLFILGVYVSISILIALHFSRKVSKPFTILTNHIEEMVSSNFTLTKVIELDNSTQEIELLNVNYLKMQVELNSYLNYFKQKVEQRTSEILQQNEEIQLQKDVIQKQKDIAEYNLLQMTDSVKYARRIKQSMLPDEERIQSLVPHSFIIHKPKDIISGDFYFIDVIKEHGFEKLVYVAGDSTGHGVPGAFMSILGLTSLSRIVYGERVTNPLLVLSALNKGIVGALRKRQNKLVVADSMDVAYCKIDLKRRKLEYAGAYRPCYIIRQNKLIELKSDWVSIGSGAAVEEKLTNQNINLEPGDCLYIFSDGYCDQFGGNEKKKFKKKAFVNLLIEINHLEMEEQKHVLEQEFEQWKGNEPQTDDVLVMGLRIE